MFHSLMSPQTVNKLDHSVTFKFPKLGKTFPHLFNNKNVSRMWKRPFANRFYKKPTIGNFRSTLDSFKNHCIWYDLKSINMPKIGLSII